MTPNYTLQHTFKPSHQQSKDPKTLLVGNLQQRHRFQEINFYVQHIPEKPFDIHTQILYTKSIKKLKKKKKIK